MNKQRDEVVVQVEVFFGMSILSLLVAALNWHGHANGGWGDWMTWVGRGFDSALCVALAMFLYWKRKVSLSRALAFLVCALAILWAMFVIGAISLSYVFFLGVFICFFVYSVFLCAYLVIRRWQTGNIGDFVNNVVDKVVFGRKITWAALLFVGTIQTWIEIRKHVAGHMPDVVLFISLPVVAILLFEAFRKE